MELVAQMSRLAARHLVLLTDGFATETFLQRPPPPPALPHHHPLYPPGSESGPQLHRTEPIDPQDGWLVTCTLFPGHYRITGNFQQIGCWYHQRMPRPQISRRKLSQIATKPQNSRKLFSLESFSLYGILLSTRHHEIWH